MDISNIGAVERPSYRLRYINSKGEEKTLYFTSMDAMKNAKSTLRAKGREVVEESLNPSLYFDKEADDYFERSNKPKGLVMEREPFPVTRQAKKGTYRIKKVSKGGKVFYEPKDIPFKGSRYMRGTDEQTDFAKGALIIGGLFVAGYLFTQNQIRKAYAK
jgi:hypothetical protein